MARLLTAQRVPCSAVPRQVTKAVGSGSEHLVMLKGAPEVVLAKCSHFFYVSLGPGLLLQVLASNCLCGLALLL